MEGSPALTMGFAMPPPPPSTRPLAPAPGVPSPSLTLQPPLPAEWLAKLRLPRGLALVPGGCGLHPLPLRDPPTAPLDSTHAAEQLALLSFAGVRYAHADAPAATVGLRAFASGRRLALEGPHRCISFDWDHTLSNFVAFEGLPALFKARLSRAAPPPALAATPLVTLEMARPFMTEFAFGAMAGFALRQGLRSLADWERYRPQVVVGTHTWPDRLALIGRHFMPLLPLMEGLLPGHAQTYERLNAPDVRCLVHLHHFIDHAIELVERYNQGGRAALSAAEHEALHGYVADGCAHRSKPPGVWARRGCDVQGLLHFDDAARVVAHHTRLAAAGLQGVAPGVLVRHPCSRVFRGVKEWHKLALPGLWRGRQEALLGAARQMAHGEARLPGAEALLRRYAGDAPWPRGELPAGTVAAVHEAPSTAGEFWRYYVEPTQRAQGLIRQLSLRHGGRRRFLQAWGDTPGLSSA